MTVPSEQDGSSPHSTLNRQVAVRAHRHSAGCTNEPRAGLQDLRSSAGFLRRRAAEPRGHATARQTLRKRLKLRSRIKIAEIDHLRWQDFEKQRILLLKLLLKLLGYKDAEKTEDRPKLKTVDITATNPPSKEAFDTPLRPPLLSDDPGPATGRSGAYPDRTHTCKPGPACRTHHGLMLCTNHADVARRTSSSVSRRPG